MTVQQVLKRLYEKAGRNSCLNCSNLRIQNGEIWCRQGVFSERFYVLDKLKIRKMAKKITPDNECEHREEE